MGNIYPNNLGALPYVGPGMETGLEYIKTKYAHQFNFVQVSLTDRRIPSCLALPDFVDDLLSRWYYKNVDQLDIFVLIAPGCTEVSMVNRLAASWNTLFISTISNWPEINNKLLSPTWITTACASVQSQSSLYVNLLRKFSWSYVFIVVDTSANPAFTIYSQAVRAAIKARIPNWQMNSETLIFFATGNVSYDKMLGYFRATSRVFLFFGNADVFRKIIVKATTSNMTNGEYVYIAIQPYHHSSIGRFHWEYHDEFDESARIGFRSVLLLALSDIEPNYRNYAERWRNISRDTYNLTYAVGDGPVDFQIASHVPFEILGQVLTEVSSTSDTNDTRDGRVLAKKFFGRTFETSFGPVTFDKNGVHQVEMIVQFFNESSDRFQSFLIQPPSGDRLLPVGDFMFANSTTMPGNKPACGYLGACISKGPGNSILLMGIVIPLSAFVLFLSCLTIR